MALKKLFTRRVAPIDKAARPLDTLNVIAEYPIAPLSDSKQPDLAKAFIEFVLSPEGQAVMAKYGFIVVK